MDLISKPFDTFFYMIHKLAFACSPIDRHKLNLELKEVNIKRLTHQKATKVDKNSEDEGDDEENDEDYCEPHLYVDFYVDWLWVIFHPVETIKLVERYHMVERKYIYLFMVQVVLTAHLLIKLSFYAIKNKDEIDLKDDELLEYYPSVTGANVNSTLVNNLWVPIISLNLFVRLKAAYMVIRNSFINRDKYQQFSISQVNFGSLIFLSELTFKDWLKFIEGSIKHQKQVEQNLRVRWEHETAMRINQLIDLHYHQAFCLHSLDDISNQSKLYHLNMIDFGECYNSPQLNLSEK